jgi:peroxiredoxin
MQSKTFSLLVLVTVLVSTAHSQESDKPWRVQGTVVDELGKPVKDFEVAWYWSANGKQSLEGDRIEPKDEGVLAPFPGCAGVNLGEGRFYVDIREDWHQASVFAIDGAHRRGGRVRVNKENHREPVSVTLVPLVPVTGKVFCSEAKKTPGWSIVIVHPEGGDRSNSLHFTNCESAKGEFSFLLPPGKYDLDVYSEEPDARMIRPKERKKKDPSSDVADSAWSIAVDVPKGSEAIDLGTLDVVPRDSDTLDPVLEYYGKQAPEIAVTDAHGVSKNVRLSDYRGKWVLLDFWGVTCVPCIKEGLPKLAKFYNEHHQDRDRFEILAICGNWLHNVGTLEDYDRLAAPIIKNVWGGKPLPFPVLIDGGEKTFDAYGVTGVPATFLIDPEGKLVKGGDEEMLFEKLKSKP